MSASGWSTWDLRLTESDVREGPPCHFCGEESTTTVEYGGGMFNLACERCATRHAPTAEGEE